MSFRILVNSGLYIRSIFLLNKFFITKFILSIPYFITLKLLKNLFKSNSNIKAVYLSGSMASKKVIYGLSDIDIYYFYQGTNDGHEKLKEQIHNIARKIPFLGSPVHAQENVINLHNFSSSSHSQKLSFILDDKKLIWGKEIDPPQVLKNDILNYIEGIYLNLYTTNINKIRKNRLIVSAVDKLNRLISSQYFSTFYECSLPKINKPEEMIEFINGLQSKESLTHEIDIKVEPSLRWSVSCFQRGHGLLSIPLSTQLDNFIYTYSQDSFSLSINQKFNRFVLKTNNFLIQKNENYFNILHKDRFPLAFSNKIPKAEYENLLDLLKTEIETIINKKYIPFFCNFLKDPSDIDYFREENVFYDRLLIHFYEGLKDKNISSHTFTPSDFYQNLGAIRTYYDKEYYTKDLKVSLCICTKNRADLLNKTLFSITKQEVMPNEIILIDNNSTDNTQEIAKNYFNKLPISISTSSLNNITELRDLAVHLANGDIIAFTDDDVLLSPNWIKNIKLAYELDEHLMLMGGKMYHWQQSNRNTSELFHRYYLGARL